jgi:hypothetical protein
LNGRLSPGFYMPYMALSKSYLLIELNMVLKELSQKQALRKINGIWIL